VFLLDPLNIQPLSWLIIGITILSLICWTVFVRYEYYAHQEVEATTMVIMLKLAPLITFSLSVIFLGEALSGKKLLGMGLIILANFLLFWRETGGKLVLKRGLKYVFLVAGSFGLCWTFDKVLAPSYGPVLYPMMTMGIPALINTMTPRIKTQELMMEIRLAKGRVLGLALLCVVGYYTMVKALTLGEASRVIPIATSTTPIVFVLAIIFLKETKNWRVKLVATVLSLLGIVALS